ncbi:MAG: Cof-type HAD-IIB family hydrolase [Coprococcus sp.]
MIKLLAIDMDGTCLDSKSRMSDKTIRALKRAADAGIMIVPTTGRALTCLPHRLVEEKGLYRYVISSNGAQVTDLVKQCAIFQSLIDRKTAFSFLRACRGQRIGKMTHVNHLYLLQGRLFYLLGRIVYGRDADNAHRVRSMEKTIYRSKYDVEEIQLYFMSRKAEENVRKILVKYPEMSAAYTKAYVEIFSVKTSKGEALAALADHLGIRKEEIVCIGDGENDLSMFEVSGLKMAMGNAVPILKKKADKVLPSNDRDGVAKAIEKYIL